MALAPHVIVIFGATGDLSRRKLLPGLLRLFQAGLMPPEFRIVGISLEEIGDDGFREFAEPACREFARHAFSEEDWSEFSRRLSYVPHSAAPDGLSARRRRRPKPSSARRRGCSTTSASRRPPPPTSCRCSPPPASPSAPG